MIPLLIAESDIYVYVGELRGRALHALSKGDVVFCTEEKVNGFYVTFTRCGKTFIPTRQMIKLWEDNANRSYT